MKINFFSANNTAQNFINIHKRLGRKNFIVIKMRTAFVELDFNNHGKVIGRRVLYFLSPCWSGTHNWVANPV